MDDESFLSIAFFKDLTREASGATKTVLINTISTSLVRKLSSLIFSRMSSVTSMPPLLLSFAHSRVRMSPHGIPHHPKIKFSLVYLFLYFAGCSSFKMK